MSPSYVNFIATFMYKILVKISKDSVLKCEFLADQSDGSANSKSFSQK